MDVSLDPTVLKGHVQSQSLGCLDANTFIALPSDWNIEEISQHGSSSWSTGYKLSLEKDGEEKEFFLKVCGL